MDGVDVPGFQTKALVVRSVSGDNFRLISACTKLSSEKLSGKYSSNVLDQTLQVI